MGTDTPVTATCTISVYANYRKSFALCLLMLFSIFYSVSIPTGYGLNDRGVGVRVPLGSRIFSSPHRPDRLWGPPSLLSDWYRGSFSGGKAAGA
jgi:hypothetical protein